MATVIVHLADPGAPIAPFRLRKGDVVAWKRSDGSPDPILRGVVVDGVCEYVTGGGAFRDGYIVRQADGRQFPARSLDLLKVNDGEAP